MTSENIDPVISQIEANEKALTKLDEALSTVSEVSAQFARKVEVSQSQLKLLSEILDGFKHYLETVSSAPSLFGTLADEVRQASYGLKLASDTFSSVSQADVSHLKTASEQLIQSTQILRTEWEELSAEASESITKAGAAAQNQIANQALAVLHSFESALTIAASSFERSLISSAESVQQSVDNLALRAQEGLDPVIRASVRLLAQMEEIVGRVNLELEDVSKIRVKTLSDEIHHLSNSFDELSSNVWRSLSLAAEQHKGDLAAAITRQRAVVERQEAIARDLGSLLENADSFQTLSDKLSSQQDLLQALSARAEASKPPFLNRLDVAITSTALIVILSVLTLDVAFADLIPIVLPAFGAVLLYEPFLWRLRIWMIRRSAGGSPHQ